jgi:DNA-binding HxlR family transcriptional regulator
MLASCKESSVLGRTYDDQNCSAARALELVGERWSLLILRDAIFAGVTTFTGFQRRLGVASNVLASRLDGFVEAGLMTTRPSSRPGGKHDYTLTEKGFDLQPVIVALSAWGDRWAAPNGPPVVYHHDGCGGQVTPYLQCAACGAQPPPEEVVTRPGPGRRPR